VSTHPIKLLFWLALCVLSTAQCTLKTYSPSIQLSLAKSSTAPKSARGGRAPQLSAITCFAVFATGTGRSVASAEVGNRSPSCLGFQGEFLGYFSYSSLTTSGANIALSAGTYGFSIVALHNSAACSGVLAPNYVSGTVTETYPVTEITTVDTNQTQNVVLPSTYEYTTAQDRTPLCAPSTFDCTGATFCDSFTDSEGILVIGGHSMDVGPGWSHSNGMDVEIIGNTAHFKRLAAENVFLFAPLAFGSATASMSVKLGSGGDSSSGLVLRYVSDDTYLAGVVYRNEGSSSCLLAIVEMNSGAYSVLESAPLSYPDQCKSDEFQTMTFSADVNSFSLSLGGRSVFVTYPSSVAGTSAGVISGGAVGVVPSAIVDWFRASRL